MNVLECSVKNCPENVRVLKQIPDSKHRDVRQCQNALLYGTCATPAVSFSGLQAEQGGLQP